MGHPARKRDPAFATRSPSPAAGAPAAVVADRRPTAELLVGFQPVLPLRRPAGTGAGFEALARYRDPRDGLLYSAGRQLGALEPESPRLWALTARMVRRATLARSLLQSRGPCTVNLTTAMLHGLAVRSELRGRRRQWQRSGLSFEVVERHRDPLRLLEALDVAPELPVLLDDIELDEPWMAHLLRHPAVRG